MPPNPFTIAKLRALSKITASATWKMAKTDRFIQVGGGITAYLGIKRGWDKLHGSAFDRPGVDITDPAAAKSPLRWGSAREISPYIRSTGFFEDLGKSFNILWRPDEYGIPKSARSLIGAPAAIIGATTGILTGMAVFAATRKPGAAFAGAIAGGVGGSTLGFRLAAGVVKTLGEISKAYYGVGSPTMDNRAYGGGKGYRTWYKKPGGSLSPGHMGADGNLPLALHKIRNRSVRA